MSTTSATTKQRAYCSEPHPGSDADADRWCEMYHRPRTPRPVAELLAAAPEPLPPHSPRLRRGRFEVTAYGPKNPTTTGRRRLAGPFRFATQPDAELYAASLTGDLVEVTRVAPADPRYPAGPWRTTTIR